MKKSSIAAALALLLLPGLAVQAQTAAPSSAATTATADEHASKERDIRRLLEVTGASKLGAQMMTTMIQSFKQTMPQAPSGFWDDFQKEIDMGELVEKIVPIYDRHLSDEDIRAAIAFYESPAGQRLITSQPVILQESMAVGMEWGQTLGKKAVAKMKQKNPQ